MTMYVYVYMTKLYYCIGTKDMSHFVRGVCIGKDLQFYQIISLFSGMFKTFLVNFSNYVVCLLLCIDFLKLHFKLNG